MSDLAETIENKLRAAFQPSELQLVDDSYKHRNHAAGAGRAHYSLRIVSAAFLGQAGVARHRAIYKVLADELAGPLHALVIDAIAPGEG